MRETTDMSKRKIIERQDHPAIIEDDGKNRHTHWPQAFGGVGYPDCDDDVAAAPRLSTG
jgi:hypothetical protein